jgi:hypothetical protein
MPLSYLRPARAPFGPIRFQSHVREFPYKKISVFPDRHNGRFIA